MPIKELRLLPPLAIGRLGSADEPLAAFDLELSGEDPLDYRRIVPQQTFKVDAATGTIVDDSVPPSIRFKDGLGRIHPVAPFIELFAILDSEPDDLVPVTPDLLATEGLTLADLAWEVQVANNKIHRRTEITDDKILAQTQIVADHGRVALEGRCTNFLAGKTLPLGHVQLIQPTTNHPEIRLRFTPATGLVYGAHAQRMAEGGQLEPDPIVIGPTWDRIIYDDTKGTWRGFTEPTVPTLTNPGQIFAGAADATGAWRSWGYLDDECDGIVRIALRRKDGSELSAVSHICAGPPTFAPDTLPIRVISDELEQIFDGPVAEEQVSIDEAEEIVRRSLETIRLLNTAVMNGNPVYGRRRVASTMVAQDTNDFGRYFEPIAAPSLADNLALQLLHRRVFSALSSGTASWFGEALRKPEEIGDLSSNARRKMPAMMRGADARALTLTRRQIDIVTRAAAAAMFADPTDTGTRAATEEGRK